MPIALQCGDLQPGMRLFEPVVWNDQIMLPSEKVLTDADVASLRRRFPDLPLRVADPVLDEIVEFEDDTREREVACTVRRQIAGATARVGERFSRQTSLKDVDFQLLNDTISEILRYLEANPVSALLLTRTLDGDGYLSEHAGNVFYLSMVMGSAANGYVEQEQERRTSGREPQRDDGRQLTPLGLGSIFMDLALTPLADLFKGKAPLTQEELKTVLAHTTAGEEMLPDDFDPAARTIVRSHHENAAGTGYPDGLAGRNIDVFARIARIADAFETATAKHVYRQAMSPVRALHEMSLGTRHQYYDQKLVKVFSRLIQPFPIGAKVLLEDGRWAVVVRYNARSPFQPYAIVAFDAANRHLPRSQLKPPIRLAADTGFRAKSFQGEDLSYLYESGYAASPSRTPEEPRTLFETAYP